MVLIALKLLKEINKQAKKHNRTINCLLQIKIAEEDSKFGMLSNDAKELLENLKRLCRLENISLVGVMGMATLLMINQIEKEFNRLKIHF